MTTRTIPDFPVSYRIRLAMELANISREQLAEYSGIHPNTVHNYLNGRTTPRRSVLRDIAELTNVDLDWLEGNDRATSAVTLRERRWFMSELYERAADNRRFALTG